MRDEDRKSREKTSEFWRACRYLAPQRRIIAISVVCAVVASALAVTGLGTMLPIMDVLFKNQSLQSWFDRQAVEKRLGVQFTNERGVVRIARISDDDGSAAQAGLKAQDVLNSPGSADVDDAAAQLLLNQLAEPASSSQSIHVNDRPALVTVKLDPLSRFYSLGRSIIYRMPSEPVKSIAAVFGLLAILAVLANTVKFFQEYFSEKAAILSVEDIRKHLYDHALHMPLGYFGLQGTSNITSRLVQDAQTLQHGFRIVLGPSIIEPINAIFYLGFAFLLSWKLTLFIVLFAPLMMAVIQRFGKKMRRASDRALRSSAEMLGQLESTLIGIRVVKAASAERLERRRYSSIMSGLVRNNVKMSRYDAMSGPLIETLTLFVAGAIVMYAAYLVLIRHELEATVFILVMGCLVGVGQSMRKISKVNNTLQKSNAAAARIFEVLDMPVERSRGSARRTGSNGKAGVEARNLINLPPIEHEVRFEDVTFTYPGAQSPAIQNVSLTVPRGQSVAVVGRNGGGKTTLMALLPRFYDPDNGRVTIDGMDIRAVTLRSLRKQISVVTQDSVIFPGSIGANIAYGHPLASQLHLHTPAIRALRDQIELAAKQAFAHDFIMEKAGGYDASLDGLGGQLSGGQKQRLNIARAIFRKTPILILDEATSQVDVESEHLIQQAIDKLIHGRTTFVIAHRFSTITSADTIVVVDRGQIVGQGKHDQLMQSCPTYVQLYERQLFAAPTSTSAASD